jgi:hypothetical protein
MIELILIMLGVILGSMGITTLNTKLREKERDKERLANEKWLKEVHAQKEDYRNMPLSDLVDVVNREREKRHKD